MMKMGMIWRAWKSRISKKIHKASMHPDFDNQIASLKPPHVSQNLWDTFVQDRLSETHKARSALMSSRSRSARYRPALGRTTLANVEYNLARESAAQGNDDHPTITDTWIRSRMHKDKNNPEGPLVPVNEETGHIIEQLFEARRQHPEQDPLTKVLGPEHPGRVRGAGLGVTPSSLKLHVHSEKSLGELRQENKRIITENKELKECCGKLDVQKQSVLEKINIAQVSPRIPDLSGAGPSGSRSSGRVSSSRPPPRPILEHYHGKKCLLIHHEIPLEHHIIVGEAKVESTDPEELCDDIPIGNASYLIHVLEVRDDLIELPFPTRDALYLGEARRTSIKWPHRFIEILSKFKEVQRKRQQWHL